MKDIFLKVLKEVGIGFAIFIILAAVTVFAFSKQLPYDEKIPTGEEYVKANMNTYSVSSTDRISEVNQITITHETNQGQIISAENEVRIQTGKYTPFGTINNTTDLPTERVGVTVSVSNNNKNSNKNDTEEGEQDGNSEDSNNENLDYPAVLDDTVSQVEQEQTESSESTAARRMGNVD